MTAADTNRPTRPNNDAILARLDGMACDLTEVKAATKEQATAFRAFEVTYTREHEKVVQVNQRTADQVRDLQEQATRHEAELKALREAVNPLIAQSKILTWLAVTFGASVMALIWMMITNQVQVVFP